MKQQIVFILMIILGLNTYAQKNVDSLYVVWNTTSKADTTRLNALDTYIKEGFIKTKKDSALYFAKVQIAYAKEKGLQEQIADGYDNLGRAYKNKGEFAKAINYYQKSYEIYKEQGNKSKMSKALSGMGSVHWTAGEYDIAKEYYQRCLTIAYELDDKKRIAQCHYDIAFCYYNQSQLDTAMKLVQQGLKIYEEIGDDDGISWGLNALGVFYSKQGNEEKALEYYFRGLKINIRIEDRLSECNSLRNIGDTYLCLGEDKKAIEYYEKSLIIDEEFNDRRSMAQSLHSIADYYSKHDNKPKALENYQQSLTLSREIGDRRIEGEFLESIGSLYIDFGENNLAITSCLQSYEIGIEIGYLEIQRDASECLYEAYKNMGSYSKALLYHEKMVTHKDSINLIALKDNLQEMEYTRQRFADSLKNEEDKLIVELSHQTELSKKKQTENVLLVSGIIALLIAIGLWSRMRFVRKANAQLKIERDRAENSELVKHQFLANMSHEIRTPMNAIKGMIDILIRRKPKKEQVTYLESIKESSNSLLVIINDILDLSKIESGKIELEQISFSIAEMVQNIYTILQFKAEEKGLELKLKIPANIPRVIGDSMRLRQVLINLIGNAIKFTDKGIITTKIEIENDLANSIVNAHFTVSDTGIGIDEDKLDSIFNSFEQAYADTSRKFGGTGLGLTISRKLIQMHQGKIWVESKKSEGSQFHFTIPFKLDTGTENIEKTSADIDIENILQQLQGINILLVEDNDFNVVVAKEELQDAIKANVSVAENGAIAIELARNKKFDVVLMDIQMPVMNGYDATKGIRNLGGDNVTVPIIAMSANVLKEEVALCYIAGMNDFIGKPFDVEILIQKIYSLTQLKP